MIEINNRKYILIERGIIMGLFSGIKRQLLKVIQWNDDTTDTIVYRYPMEDRDEIMNGCQLIVTESQCAMLVSGGQICDVYGPGTHSLTTNNMPIITKLASWKYGFDSPFKADVYYVNTKQFINMKWGTSTKVSMRDKDFGIIRVGGRGTYSFKIEDAPKFMREIFGTNREYTTSALMEYFKSIIVSGFTNVLGEAAMSALDLPAKLLEFGDHVKQVTDPDFDAIGVTVVNLKVESVALPEEVEKAIDQRSSLGAMSGVLGEFTQYQTAQAIRDAANNPNSGMASAGVGLGAGVAIGQAMGQAMGQALNNNNNNQNTSASGVVCPKCHTSLPAGSKFCNNCGAAVNQNSFCTNCGSKVVPGSKFCNNCGQKLN